MLFRPISIKDATTFELKLWQAAEEYLKPLAFTSEIFEGHKTAKRNTKILSIIKPLDKNRPEAEDCFITALKVISYVTLLPVFISAGISLYFRNTYSLTEDEARDLMLRKDTFMNLTDIGVFLKRMTFKVAFEKTLPPCLGKCLDANSYDAIFKRTFLNWEYLPGEMIETYPPKMGRLATLFHINGNHYTGLFIDFGTKTLFYYDPFGNDDSCPVNLGRVREHFFPGEELVATHIFSKDTHQKDGVNCGKYVLKFFEELITSENPDRAFNSFTSETIDREQIYSYTEEIVEKYPSHAVRRPAKVHIESDPNVEVIVIDD